MNTEPISPTQPASALWAVPPLPRDESGAISADRLQSLVRHIEDGGISTLLFGGNAIFYHLRLAEYRAAVEMLPEVVSPDTAVIPSLGPAYGTMLDQVDILRDHDYPSAMVLPQRHIIKPDGYATAIRRVSDALDRPLVLYLKYDRVLSVGTVKSLVDDGVVAAVKYAIVRADTADDPFLQELTEVTDPVRIVSGLGELPAPAHVRGFGLGGFTTGSGCVAPRLSLALLAALRDGDDDRAASLCETFGPLERLRNKLSPITVLHAAVELAGITPTGPVIPLLHPIDDAARPAVKAAAEELLADDREQAEV